MAEPTIPSDPTIDPDMAYDLKRAGEERSNKCLDFARHERTRQIYV